MAKINPLGQLQICPFCKKNDEVVVYSLGNQYFYVGCNRCVTENFDFSTSECSSQVEAEANWNTRPENRRMIDNILSCPLCGERAGWKHISNDSVMLVCYKCGARTMAVSNNNDEVKKNILSIWNGKSHIKTQ